MPPAVGLICLDSPGIYGLYDSDEQGGLIHAIASRGVAVLAWDLTGHGSRQTEAASTFYRRFRGGASRLGAMVGEVQSALDFIHCEPLPAAPREPCLAFDRLRSGFVYRLASGGCQSTGVFRRILSQWTLYPFESSALGRGEGVPVGLLAR